MNDRRHFLKQTVTTAAALSLPSTSQATNLYDLFFAKHFLEMSREETNALIEGLEKKYQKKYQRQINISRQPAQANVLFGYGLDLSRCVGCRRCVYGCVEENNQSRAPQVHWISVLRFKKGDSFSSNLEKGDTYYYPEKVPEKGHTYMPISCQHCENPPCVKACPTQATWKENDGIVVIDYDWCVGCRYCMAACPYGARRFNWAEPNIVPEEINPNTHYLGNRPRYKGVVEKCSFCIQRVRKEPGRYPACVEVCPVGARKFGNLLDPNSEIRYCIENKRVFRLKEDKNTEPKFYYFFAT